MQKDQLRLILVTHKSPSTPVTHYLDFIESCIAAGLTSVQLRQKEMSADELFQFGKVLHQFLRQRDIPLLINDHIELCQQLNAEGVHLGQADGNILNARETLGKSKIIGLSVNSLSELQQANNLPVDYLGAGAIFPTASKPDIQTISGIEGLQQVTQQSQHPIVAIGGITLENVKSVFEAGPIGIAAIGLFHNAPDPYAATHHLDRLSKEVYSS